MRRLAFIICILSTFILLTLLVYWPAQHYSSLETLIPHERVFVEGVVKEEIIRGTFRVFYIDSIEVRCECSTSYLGKQIQVEGYLEDYRGERYVRALRIYSLFLYT